MGPLSSVKNKEICVQTVVCLAVCAGFMKPQDKNKSHCFHVHILALPQ